jgi:uncharacterized protein DUF3311
MAALLQQGGAGDGMPFFYWYQLLWVIIGAILTAIVYFVTEAQARGPRADEP